MPTDPQKNSFLKAHIIIFELILLSCLVIEGWTAAETLALRAAIPHNSEMPRITAEKLPLTSLWIDTSVGIKLAKVARGERLQDIELQRLARLRELVFRLVREQKLLCPEADQDEEYEAERLEEAVAREFANLSLGIKMQHREGILDSQILLAMEAYVNKAAEFRIPAALYFRRDPIQRMKEVIDGRIIVSVHGAPPQLVEMRRKNKCETITKWEELRRENVAKRQSYEQQFALEQRAYVDTMADMVRAFQEKVKQGTATFMDFMGVWGYNLYIKKWYGLTQRWADWEGICNFFISDYFYELPIMKIRSQLYADLMTREQPIESGDSMDVQHLSIAIPGCHYVLTDRKMANRVARLGIAEPWDTRVFSMANCEELFVELEKL